MELKFNIPVTPVPKASVRVGRHGSYMPLKTRRTMDQIRAFVGGKYPGEPLDGPVVLEACFYQARTNGTRKRRFPHTKPDIDNYMKLIADSLEGVLWTNDSRIVEAKLKKLFCLPGEWPRIELIVREAS